MRTQSRSAALTFEAMAAEYLERMGARIRQRRDELGLSRDEVAKQMPGKTNGNAIYRWERGDHRPHDDTLEALAAVLECDVSYFLAAEPAEGTGDLMGALNSAPSQLDRIEALLHENAAKLELLYGLATGEMPSDVISEAWLALAGKPARDAPVVPGTAAPSGARRAARQSRS